MHIIIFTITFFLSPTLAPLPHQSLSLSPYMTEHFPPPILNSSNYSTLASLHIPATTSISTHQLPFSPASPSCMSPLQLPPLSPLPPCTTLHQSSLHQALPLNDTHFCDKKNDEADCGPGFRSSHKNTAKNKMRSSQLRSGQFPQEHCSPTDPAFLVATHHH